MGPIMAAASKDLDALVDDVKLHLIAVEFDLVDAAFAIEDILDR
jgi:hypothetical protein